MERKTKTRIKAAGVILFVLYLIALAYFLFFAEALGRAPQGRQYCYNLRPFKEILRFWNNRKTLGFWAVTLNLAGNVAAFVPFGMILPVFVRRARRPGRIALLSLELSFIMEFCQLIFRVGSFDVDDMLLNTLGGLLGYFLFRICDIIGGALYG